MIISIYNSSTGQIVAIRSIKTDPVVNEGYAWIQGRFDPANQYIDATGQAQTVPERPQDDKPYKFDWTTKTWNEIIVPVNDDTVRQQRNVALAEIDKISATRYASLSPEQQQELQAYRQALLDVPQQEGFPADVSWPAKPTWL
jgi:hypothetical protein